MHDYDCVTRRVVFRNNDRRKSAPQSHNQQSQEEQQQQDGSGFSKVIQKASSLTIDFEQPSKPFHMVQLSGR